VAFQMSREMLSASGDIHSGGVHQCSSGKSIYDAFERPRLTWYVEDEDLIEECERREEEDGAEEQVEHSPLIPSRALGLQEEIVEGGVLGGHVEAEGDT